MMDNSNSPGQVLSKLQITRNEINNIRKNMCALKFQHKKDLEMIEDKILKSKNKCNMKAQPVKLKQAAEFIMEPIGYLRSCFKYKNGTPRQGSLVENSRGTLAISKSVFNNPEHSLDGLSEYSHVWVLFIFDKNKGSSSHSKVSPPRLNGEKLGIFATRSPHRPNPVGLTLAKLDKVEGYIIHLSGIDILNGTPIIDVKPYIPMYDFPVSSYNNLIPFQTSIATESETNNLSLANSETITVPKDNEEMDIVSLANNEKNIVSLVTNEMNTVALSNKKTIIVPIANEEMNTEHITPLTTSTQNEYSLSLRDYTTNQYFDSIREAVTDNDKILMKANTITSCGYNNIYELIEPVEDFKKVEPELVSTPDWIQRPPAEKIQVIFNRRAIQEIEKFSMYSAEIRYRTKFIRDGNDLMSAINKILSEEPRSCYRRQNCEDRLYFFTVDTVHVTSWFIGNEAEVLRVRPISAD